MVLVLCQCFSVFASGKQNINILNLLLPLSSHIQVEYPLQAFNGCYSWRSSNPDIISINPIADADPQFDCFNTAMARVETKKAFNGTIWLMATDKDTGNTIKCEARVAYINRVEILTRLRTVYVEDFETLEIIAYDDENNSFNSLEGFKFSWTITQKETLAAFQSFKESNVQVTQIRQAIEDNGSRTDQIVLKGQKIGEIGVKTEIDDRDYRGIGTDIRVYIIEHFDITPKGPIFMLPCSSIEFHLNIIRTRDFNKEPKQIQLPNKNYRFDTDNGFTGTIEQNGRLVLGEHRDPFILKVFNSQKIDNMISREITVTDPYELVLYIKQLSAHEIDMYTQNKFNYFDSSPYNHKKFDNNWNLLKEESYLLMPVLLDENNNRIYTDNLDFEWETDRNSLEVSENLKLKHNSIVIKPLKNSFKTEIKVTLNKLDCVDRAFTDKKTVNVISRVSIIKPITETILIPVDGTVLLNCIGGSGKYVWDTTDSAIAVINQLGNVKALKEGTLTVYCIDKTNLSSQDKITIMIRKPAKISVLERKKELLKGKENTIAIRYTDEDGNVFSNFVDNNSFYEVLSGKVELTKLDYDRKMIIKEADKFRENTYISAGQEHLQYDIENYLQYIEYGDITLEDLENTIRNSSSYGIAGLYSIISHLKGNSQVQFSHPQYGNDISKIQTFNPLIIKTDLEYDEKVYGKRALLMPFTSIRFIVKEGPKPWFGSKSTIGRVYDQSAERDSFKHTLHPRGDLMEVIIECDKESFEERLIGSFMVFSNNEANSELINPISISESLTVECAHPSSIMISDKNHKRASDSLSLKNDKTHKLNILAFDNTEKLFWKNDSLNVIWSKEGTNIGSLLYKSGVANELALSEQVGEMKITASSANYTKSNTQTAFEQVTDQLTINSVNMFSIEPNELVLLLHKSNVEKIKIMSGSGDFSIVSSNESVIEFYFNDKNNEIEVKPISLGETTLKIKDNRLSDAQELECRISVVNLTRIELTIDKRLLQTNERAKVSLTAYSNNTVISNRQLKLTPIRFKKSRKELVVDDEQDSVYVYSPSKGDYDITAISDFFGVSSNTLFLDVFEPISTFPKDIILAPGCNGFFKVIGGPSQRQMQEMGYKIDIKLPSTISKMEELESNFYTIPSKNSNGGIIVVQLLSSKNEIISKSELVVVQKPVTALVVIGNTELIEGTSSKLLVIPKTASGYLSPSTCNMWFDSKKDSSQAIELTNNTKMDLLEHNTFVLRFDVNALRKGVSTVSVTLKQKSKSLVTTDIEIKVLDNLNIPIQFSLRSSDCLGGAFLMSVNSYYDIPNKHMISEGEIKHIDNVVRLSSNNTLISQNKQGTDVLLLGNQKNQSLTTVSVVQPKVLIPDGYEPTTYIQTNVERKLSIKALDHQARLINNLPKDSDFDFFVSDPSIISFKYDEFDNNFIYKSLKEGKAFLFIASRNYPELFDVLEFRVRPAISESGKIVIPFNSKISADFLNIDDITTIASSNEEIVQIDSDKKIVAVGEGNAKIKLRASNLFIIDIEVIRINKLYHYEKNPTTITNIKTIPEYKDGYVLLYKLGSTKNQVQIPASLDLSTNFTADCKTDNDSFNIINLGFYNNEYVQCKVVFKPNKTVDKNRLTITVSLKEANKGTIVEEMTSLNVLSKFEVPDRARLIRLSKNNTSFEFKINTNRSLNMTVGQSALKNFVKSFFENGVFKVIIQIPFDYQNKIISNITIKNPSTQQEERINVEYDPKSSIWDWISGSTINALGFQDIAVVIICTFLLLFIVREITKKKPGNFQNHSFSQMMGQQPHSSFRTRNDHYSRNFSRMEFMN